MALRCKIQNEVQQSGFLELDEGTSSLSSFTAYLYRQARKFLLFSVFGFVWFAQVVWGFPLAQYLLRNWVSKILG